MPSRHIRFGRSPTRLSPAKLTLPRSGEMGAEAEVDAVVSGTMGRLVNMLGAVADRALDPEAVWGKFARDSLRWSEVDSNPRSHLRHHRLEIALVIETRSTLGKRKSPLREPGTEGFESISLQQRVNQIRTDHRRVPSISSTTTGDEGHEVRDVFGNVAQICAPL
jgi:hypothetical protein